MSSRRRIAVLGGGGFLGSHLVQALLRQTDARLVLVDVRCDRLQVPADTAPDRLEVIQRTITDHDTLQKVVSGCDPVLSLAAICNPSFYNTRPREVIDANFTHLVPLVDLCTRHRRWLVHFSTCEVYGRPLPDGGPMNEETTPLVLGPIHRERWTYACAKQLLERLIWAQQVHDGLRATIVRPFNVIGPRMDHLQGIDGDSVPRVLACFMQALLLQRPLRLVEGGTQRRCFLAVEDFVDAVMRILERPQVCEGRILNIGNPDNDVSIHELAHLMVKIYGQRQGGDPHLPCQVVTNEAFYGPGYDDAAWRVPDIGLAARLLSWQPRTTLGQMLPGIIDDYVARYGPRIAGHAQQ